MLNEMKCIINQAGVSMLQEANRAALYFVSSPVECFEETSGEDSTIYFLHLSQRGTSEIPVGLSIVPSTLVKTNSTLIE